MSERGISRGIWGLLAAGALLHAGRFSIASDRRTPRQPAQIEVADVQGRVFRPLAQKARRTTLLLFIAHDCPISNAYAPEIGRICKAYQKSGVATYVVYVERDLKPADARKHAHDYAYPCPAIIDRQRKLVKFTGARMTPEAVLLDARDKVVYSGRIDDTYIDYGKRRDAPTTRDLRRAIDALLAHKSVSPGRTKVIGCYIPDIESVK